MDEDFGRYSSLGCQFAVTLILFSFAGHGVDRWLDTTPWFMLLGTFTGFAGALYALVKKVGPTHDRPARDPDERAPAARDESPTPPEANPPDA